MPDYTQKSKCADITPIPQKNGFFRQQSPFATQRKKNITIGALMRVLNTNLRQMSPSNLHKKCTLRGTDVAVLKNCDLRHSKNILNTCYRLRTTRNRAPNRFSNLSTTHFLSTPAGFIHESATNVPLKLTIKFPRERDICRTNCDRIPYSIYRRPNVALFVMWV